MCAFAAHADAKQPKKYMYVESGNVERSSCIGMPTPGKDEKQPFCVTSDSPYPQICRFVDGYEKPYNQGWKDWNAKNPDARMPEDTKVYSIIIPGDQVVTNPGDVWKPRYKATSSTIMNVYVDPSTKRVIRYTLERRNPPEKPNPSYIRSHDFWDPRIKRPVSDSKIDYALSENLVGSTLEAQALDFDERLNGWMGQASARKCDFLRDHNRESGYARNPGARQVDEFFKASCDGPFAVSRCHDGEPAFAKNPVLPGDESAGDKSFHAIDKVEKAVEKTENVSPTLELNRALLKTLREAMLRSEAKIVSEVQGDSAFDSFPLGPEKAHLNCGIPENEDLDALKKSFEKGLADPAAADQRKAMEWMSTRKHLYDMAEMAKYYCHSRNSYGLGAPVKTNDPDRPWSHDNAVEEQRLNAARDRNRVLGHFDEDDFEKRYNSMREVLKSNAYFKDIRFDLFTSGRACRGSDAGFALSQFKDKLAKIQIGSPEYSFLMDPKGKVLTKIRDAKMHALKHLRAKLTETTQECGDAGTKSEFNWLTKDNGLQLWQNGDIVGATVQKEILAGNYDKVDRMHAIWCQNNKDRSSGMRNRGIVFGVATGALLFVPVVGEMTGSVAISGFADSFAFAAMNVTMASAGLGVAIKGVSEASERYDDADLAYAANIGSIEKMNDAQRDFYYAMVNAGVAAGLTAVQVFNFAKLAAASLAAGRALSQTESGFYYANVSKALKEGKISKAEIRAIMGDKNACPAGDCKAAFERLAAAVNKEQAPPPVAEKPPVVENKSAELEVSQNEERTAAAAPGSAKRQQDAAAAKAKQNARDEISTDALSEPPPPLPADAQMSESELTAMLKKADIEDATDVVQSIYKEGKTTLLSDKGGTRLIFRNTAKPGVVIKVTKKHAGLSDELLDSWVARDTDMEKYLVDQKFRVAKTQLLRKENSRFVYDVDEVVGPKWASFYKQYKVQYDSGDYVTLRGYFSRVNAAQPGARAVNAAHLKGIKISSADAFGNKLKEIPIEEFGIDAKGDNIMMQSYENGCPTCVRVVEDGKTFWVNPLEDPIFVDY